MTKSVKKLQFAIISIILAVVSGLFYCLTYYQKPAQRQTETITRNIEISKNALDCQSIFDSFEDSKLEMVDNITSFEGVKTFNLEDFDELDFVSDSNIENLEMKIKYAYTYDNETNFVTLTVTQVSGELTEIVDTMIGVAFVNDDGDLDAVFDCDGEYLLLSELQDLEQVQNCGWFKKALKKIKKVVSNPVGAIGTAVTVAATIAVGIVSAGTLPLIATVAIGAAVGATGMATTAIASTAIQEGKVDWEAVGICAGVGAAVGALTSGIAYGFTTAIKSATSVVKAQLGNKLDYAFGKATGNAHNIARSAENASQLSKIGIYNNSVGRQILTEHFNNALTNNAGVILAENAGRVEISTLLSGPGGFLNVQSVWEGAKLITFWFIG